MKSFCPFASQKGQALLIVLLVMAVVLTSALAIVSRSITDITVSQKEEESARAFSAAEAGIERALIEAVPAGEHTLPAGGSYQVGTGETIGGGRDFILPTQASSGDILPVWLVSHNTSGNIVCDDDDYPCFTGTGLKICWGAENTPGDSAVTPAIEVSVFYRDGSNIKIGRGAYDPYPTRRTTGVSGTPANRFDSTDTGTCQIGSTNFAFSKTITFDAGGLAPQRGDEDELNGPQIARIRFFYNTDRTHPVGVQAQGGDLPAQGTKIVSTGMVGNVTRKIEVSRLFEDLPPIFDFGLFSGGSLVKTE